MKKSIEEDLFGNSTPFASASSPFSRQTTRPFSRQEFHSQPFNAQESHPHSQPVSRTETPRPEPQPGISTRNLPPSVWGKTLRKVAPTASCPDTTKGSCTEAASLHAGNVVNHNRFGRGTIVSVEGTGMDAKATVDFDNVGRKVLLLRFAKFTVVG